MASDFKLSDCYVETRKQPCWDCANACGGCEWSDHLEPVPGWDATPTSRVLKVGGKGKGGTRVASSFVIHYCPKFRRG